MKAGFARACITPPLGTTMIGFGRRDQAGGCTAVHDDLFARALWVEDGAEAILIIAHDLCFLDRDLVDRIRGALGRRTGLAPRRILLNASHTHGGPATHRWGYLPLAERDRLYLETMVAATLRAALAARAGARAATLHAAVGRTTLPRSRRLIENGKAVWAPAPASETCDALPVCLFRDARGAPICLLFSASCHPSTLSSHDITADFPGDAAARLDARLGAPVSLFLQGCGGDAKPSVCAEERRWRYGSWPDVAAGGELLARETLAVLPNLRETTPSLRAAEVETAWPLEGLPDRAALARVADDPAAPGMRGPWARWTLQRLDAGLPLPAAVPVTLHGLRLASDVRLVGLEGEAVAAWGNLFTRCFGGGVTFPLGYSDGAQLYLPVSAMLAQGGYEVESFHEYGFPARFAAGMEGIVTEALDRLGL